MCIPLVVHHPLPAEYLATWVSPPGLVSAHEDPRFAIKVLRLVNDCLSRSMRVKVFIRAHVLIDALEVVNVDVALSPVVEFCPSFFCWQCWRPRPLEDMCCVSCGWSR